MVEAVKLPIQQMQLIATCTRASVIAAFATVSSNLKQNV